MEQESTGSPLRLAWIDLMSRLTTAFGGLPPIRIGTEARYPLRNCIAAVERPGAINDPVPVTLIDIAPRGVGLVSPIELRPADEYELWVKNAEVAAARRWPIRIAWAVAHGAEGYRAGATILFERGGAEAANSNFKAAAEPPAPTSVRPGKKP